MHKNYNMQYWYNPFSRLIFKHLSITLFLLLPCFGTMAQQSTVLLKQWRLTCPDPADTAFSTSLTVSVPGCLHTDLLDHGLIPDPFYGTNEESLQWLSHVPCTYTCEIWKDELPFKKNIELVLEGVTGYAEIFLNGQPLYHQDNTNVMDNTYRTWRFPLDKKIHTYNLIEVRFTPAQQIIDQRKASVPYSLPEERAWLRMPPYQSGWDWGPQLTTCGIMGNAYIGKCGSDKQLPEQLLSTRSVELRQTKDSVGQSFEFVINGKPVFAKGVNWIPSDFFPHRMTEERYRELLQACKDANINMIRVWGGGIYEPDIFYDLCDEMGIMVWQDFMFAGTLYPGDKSFLDNVKKEATEQVLRLRHHPCIVLWCGNNEVKNGWEDWGWQANYTAEQREQLDHDMHYLFDTLLANVVSMNGNGVPYIPTSPLWGWGHPECCTEGDSHYWGVWWGELPFEMWYQKTGRFMSEYGFQSYPDIRTLQTVVPDTALYLGSAALNNHQKHARGVQIIDKAMHQYFHRPDNLEDYVYVSQLVQAYGIGMAIEEHRRRTPYCMGTLVWQLNDCWPVASWSCIDYYGRRKALYYEMKRQFAPVIIACDTMQNGKLPIYVVNDSNESVTCDVLVRLCQMDGTDISSKLINNLEVKTGQSCLVWNFDITAPLGNKSLNQYFLHIWCWGKNRETLFQKIKVLCPPGQMDLSGDDLTVYRIDDTTVAVSSSTLQYGVELTANVDGYFDDNYFTLLPGTSFVKVVKFVPKEAIKGNVVFTARGYHN